MKTAICILFVAYLLFAATADALDDWTQQFPDPQPSARERHAMAYIGGDQVLLYGGRSSNPYLSDTWVYDLSESIWTQKFPASSPGGLREHAMAYIGDDQVLLFGGWKSESFVDETWIYDLSDTTWTQLSPASKPSARVGPAMAYVGGDQVLLFGGVDASGFNDETWVFDLSDTTWSPLSLSPKPSARTSTDMAYIGGDQVLLFGGYDGSADDDTWVFDLSDTTWSQLTPSTKPSARLNHRMAYMGGDQVLLFGGRNGGYQNDTWAFDLSDTAWSQDFNTTQPSARELFGFSETSMDGSSFPVLFGGYDGGNHLDETWTYDPAPDTPQVTVTYPNGGETLAFSATITWTASDGDPGETALLSVDLDYSADAGTIWVVIDSNRANDGAHLWDLSGLPEGDNYLVRITATDTTGLSDSNTSDAVFSVVWAADDWTQQSPEHSPTARCSHALAHIGGDQALLFGGEDVFGYTDEAYSYSLSYGEWYRIFYQEKGYVSPRSGHAMAYIGGDQVLLFGGEGDVGYNDTTWVYDLSADAWTQLSPSSQPSARVGHAMAYIGGDNVLLFGGEDDVGHDDETWIFDLSDTTWIQLDPAIKPAARVSHDMAYIGGDQVLLFGGYDGAFDDETWIFDLSDTAWTQLSPSSQPSAREGHAMAYFGGDRVLLFGGEDDIGYNDETWIFDLSDTIWTRDFNSAQPSARKDHGLCESSMDRVNYLILFGGNDGSYDNETWIFGGGDYPVPDPPQVTVAYPNGGESLKDTVTITWTATDPDPGETALLIVDLDYSTNGGGVWAVIDSSQANDGSYFWDISGLPDGNDYLVRITATDTTGLFDSDNSDMVFFIDNDPDSPQVSVTYPDGGEILAYSATITWAATDPDPGETALLVVDLDYSADAGTTWSVIDSNQTNDGAYLWDLSTLPEGHNYLVRATATDTTGLFDADTSDDVFTILQPADDWAQQFPDPHPSARYFHAMAYIGEDKALLFGGLNSATEDYDDETWIFDLGDDGWTQLSPASRPSPRMAHEMAYIGGDHVLLFGGEDATGCDDETWIFDLSENTWNQLDPWSKKISQPPQAGHAMAYIGGDQILSFGGVLFEDTTWVYDLSESTWTQQNPATRPSARWYHAMAYLGGDKALLFGGKDDVDLCNDTWVYDLSDDDWTQQNPVTKPSARWFHEMAYLGEDQVLLFGGEDAGGYRDDTWIYDLSDDSWTQDFNTIQPSARAAHGLYESSMDGSSPVVLFGGLDDDYDAETWTFGGGDYLVPDPPAAIADLKATLADSAIHLSWTAVTADTAGKSIDVDHYTVYRDDDPGFSPGPSDSIGSTADTFYVDSTAAVKDTVFSHYYVVRAVDSGGRKSADCNRVGEFDRNMLNAPAK
jgi:N-acetylneuraminic acid mutarotase